MNGKARTAVGVGISKALYADLDERAAMQEVSTTDFINAVLTAARDRGIIDNLAIEGMGDVKRRNRRDLPKWEAEGEAERSDKGPFNPRVYRHGPFTLERLGPLLSRGGGETDGWWLHGPSGDHYLGKQRTPARRRADELVTLYERTTSASA